MFSIKIWGVRGSSPRAEAGFLDYGGNTSCLCLDWGGGLVVLDAGTGLARLERREGKRLDLLLSHLHLDHILGLFSFRPLFDPDLELHLYGAAGFRRRLEALAGGPYWPVGFQDVPGRVLFHELRPGEGFSLADGAVRVETMEGCHPGGSILYRLERQGRRVVYALDCELTRAIAPALTDFARGSDLLIWDAGFAPEDLRPGWGHSTWAQGIDVRRSAGAGAVLMTHYGWDYDDTFLRRQEALARREDACCRFAREGMAIEL